MDSYSMLKEMFCEMVIKKNANLIPHYYHPDFILYTNGTTMNYDAMLDSHLKIYQTPIEYKIRYEDETAVVEDEKVAVRMFITTSKPNHEAVELELMLIAQYKHQKLYRIWELTYPDWSQDPKFKDVLENPDAH